MLVTTTRLLSRSLRGGFASGSSGFTRGGSSVTSGFASRSSGFTGGFASGGGGVTSGSGSFARGVASSGSSVLSGFGGRFLLRASDERKRQRESSEDHFCVHVIYHPK